MTYNDHDQFFKIMNWREVRPHFLPVEPKLVEIIDRLSPSNKYNFLRVSYPYGTNIFANKIVHVPSNHASDSIPITHPTVDNWIKKLIGQASLPLGVITDRRGAEFFIETDNIIHPVLFCVGGLNIGIWEHFEPPTPLTITAGARSLILLPKITDLKKYMVLDKYGIKATPPRSPFEQWHLFKNLVRHPSPSDPWMCDVFYFTDIWTKQIKKDPAWFALKYFILERAWQHTSHNRYKFIRDDMWASFADILSKEHVKPASHLLDVLKYLIHIAIERPAPIAYKPTNGNEAPGPINKILKVLLEVYGLKNYSPTLMVPTHFDSHTCRSPVYCPLQIPIWWSSTPRSRDSISTKRDLDNLVWLFDQFVMELDRGNIRVSNDDIKKVSFDFFHSDGIKGTRIQPTAIMAQEDCNLLYMPENKKLYGTRKFADRSTFARGCVRISVKKNR